MKNLISLCLCASVLNLFAAVPLRWTVETSRAEPASFDQFAGATYDLEAALQCGGKPLAVEGDARLYWQTNGMGSAWWSAAATVSGNVIRASWTPSCDVGARVYNCFLGIPGSVYNAAFQLRLRPSPGAIPNALEPPLKVLDLEHTVVINEPWPTDETIDARIRQVIHDDGITAEVNPAEIKGLVSNTVDKAYVEALGIEAGLGESEVQGIVASAVSANEHVGETNQTVRGRFVAHDMGVDMWEIGVSYAGYAEDATTAMRAGVADYAGGIEDGINWLKVDPESGRWESCIGGVTTHLANMDDLPTSPEDIGAASAADLEPLATGYQRLYNFVSGSTNACIFVTNYPPTAAEAAGRTHFDPADPDLDFSTVPASLRLDETRDGETRTVVDTRDWTVWYFAAKLPRLLSAAQEYAANAYSNAVETLAAWAGRTASGLENPAGDTTLVIDVPNIWLMTDQQFEKHVDGGHACWVIRSKNASVSPNVTTNGFLELTDAFGNPYIRFNKTEATFADPPPTGISYDSDADEWLITYTTATCPKGGANLALTGNADYPGHAILKAEDDDLCPAVITWTGTSGNWTMHAKPKPVAGAAPDRMFFGATVEIEGQDYIEYLKPVSFSHIILPSGKKIAPDVPASAAPGTAVTWKVVP